MSEEEKRIWSQVASASRIVFEAADSVACAVLRVGCFGKTPRILTSGATRGQTARVGALSVPRIHDRTARCEQYERSAVRTLWPTPGTTINRPCGNWSTPGRAFQTGVRMSKPPFTASTG